MTRRPASHPTRLRLPAVLSAPPGRRAVSTAAVRIAARCEAEPWTRTGAPAARRRRPGGAPAARKGTGGPDHAVGSRPQRAAQPVQPGLSGPGIGRPALSIMCSTDSRPGTC